MPLLGRHKSLQGASGQSKCTKQPTAAPLVCESPLFGVRRQLPLAAQAAELPAGSGAASASPGRPLVSSVSLTQILSSGSGSGSSSSSSAAASAADAASSPGRQPGAAKGRRGRAAESEQQQQQRQQLADQLETLSSIPKQITRQQIHYAFSIMDSNADGLVDLRDLSQMLANLGVPIDEAILSHVLTSSVSKRGDHLITENEFLNWIGNFIQVSDLLVPGEGATPAPGARRSPVARSSSSGAAALAAHSPEAQFAIDQQRRQRRGSGSGLALIRSLSSSAAAGGPSTSSSSLAAAGDDRGPAGRDSAAAHQRQLQQLEQLQETRNDLKAAFCVFDLDGDGFITIDEVQQGLKLLGESWSQQELNQVFSRCEGAGSSEAAGGARKGKAAGKQQQKQQRAAGADLTRQRISIDDFVKLLL